MLAAEMQEEPNRNEFQYRRVENMVKWYLNPRVEDDVTISFFVDILDQLESIVGIGSKFSIIAEAMSNVMTFKTKRVENI